jgi:hypothetical protein
VLGTIHASKGREADEVVLGLPPPPGQDDDIAEETRVLYVGATRPRKKLTVYEMPESKAYPLESGRLWSVRKTPAYKPYVSATVEFGRDGDVDKVAGVQAPLASSPADAEASQRLLAGAASGLVGVVAHCSKDWDYDAFRLELVTHPGRWVGRFTKWVQNDLLEIRKWFRNNFKLTVRTPWKIDRLHLFAVRTVAIGDDDPLRASLHEPYRTSGFLLAPVVAGYPVTFFRKAK